MNFVILGSRGGKKKKSLDLKYLKKKPYNISIIVTRGYENKSHESTETT